jgi:hypothetical protein
MALVALLLLLLAVAPLAAAQTAATSRVVIEMGWAAPLGELGDDYPATRIGLGARDGLEVGFGWRYQLSNSLSLSPAFHFVDYRNFTSTAPVIGDYRIAASSQRYTVEAMVMSGDEARPVRVFFAASAGLYRNRLEGFHKLQPEAFDESINTLGLAVRGGVHLGPFELSAVYGVNRFATWQFLRTGAEEEYSWDSFTVRAGWVLPFSDGPPKGQTR